MLVPGMDDLIVYLADTTVGQTVTPILRNGEEQIVEMTLKERPTR